MKSITVHRLITLITHRDSNRVRDNRERIQGDDRFQTKIVSGREEEFEGGEFSVEGVEMSEGR